MRRSRVGGTQREVLIPLAAGGDGRLGRVAADRGLPPPHPAQLERAISELLEVGLYGAGQAARAAVRQALGLRFFQPLTARLSLYPLNPGDFLGLGEENSDSAQLGLALALLMCRAQSPARVIMATGALDIVTGSREVAVRPVAHVGEKLQLLHDAHARPGASPAPALALIPSREPDGADPLQRHAALIARLDAMGTRVVPVATLAEAVRWLGATRAWVPWPQKLAAAALLGAVLAVGGALGVRAWQQRPIALEFVPIVDAAGQVWMTPARGRLVRGVPVRLGPLCPESTPLMLSDEALVLAVAPADRAAEHVAYALVAVSAEGLKLLPAPAADRRDQHLRTWVSMEPGEDLTLVAVLAWRQGGGDLAALESRLRAVIDRTRPGERIARARNLLSGVAPGQLQFLIRSRPAGQGGAECQAV